MTKRMTLIPLRLRPATVEYLDRMRAEGGHSSRAALVRSLIEQLVADDRHEHGEGWQPIGQVAQKIVEELK
jgi:metal-responsive CopG/Arc/MetJ family transcriptional regulator